MEFRNGFDDLFFTTVRVEAHPEDTPRERRFGTAFFVERLENGRSMVFLITCRHVVERAETGVIYFMEGESGNPLFTLYPAEINHFQLGWVPHPNPRVDIAVMYIDPLLLNILNAEDKKIFTKFIRESEFPSDAALRKFNAIEELLFVGYPGGVFDRSNGLPIVRRGITASPLFVNYERDPAFLLDGAVRGGSSGSPVFVGSPAVKVKPDGTFGGGGIDFVGVVAEMLQDPYHRPTNEPNDRALDIGVVYKPSCVTEAMDEWFVHARRNDASTTKDRPAIF